MRVTIGLALALATLTVPVARGEDELDWGRLERETVERLRAYLRLDTTNPPGNESRAVRFLADLLQADGIPSETVESAPGRGSLWARLEGGDQPALVLLHHSDVVPADPRFWQRDPFSGDLDAEGYVWGRGALDTKGLGILHLQTFLALHRRGRPLNRDVLFLATADEEAGGFLGAGWLVEHRPEVFNGVGLLLNEGGGGMLVSGRAAFSVEVTQKVPLWLRLRSPGVPGHGSTPGADSAVERLVRALARLAADAFEPRIVPEVARYLEGLAELQPPSLARRFRDLEAAIADPGFLDQLQDQNPRLHALLRSTCSITRLEGSSKINVVPPEATAELDCRLLPDEDPARFVAHLRQLLGEPQIETEIIMGFSAATSAIDTELFAAIEAVSRAHYPGAVVVPSVAAGFTDSHFFRDLGITSYGFSPTLLSVAEAGSVHGNNERVSVENLHRGVRMMLDILERVVY